MVGSKSYNRIIDYLENEAGDFANAIKNCCIEYMLSPAKKRGITLLLPKDESLRAQIYSLSIGDPDDKQQAVELISSLIIPLNLKTPSDFALNKDILQNSLRRVIEIGEVKGEEVTLAAGGVVKIDPRFKDASRDGILNVYMLDSDVGVPLDSPLAAKIPTVQRPKKREDGSQTKGIPTDNINNKRAQQLRFQISVQVENIYARDMIDSVEGKSLLRQSRGMNVFIENAYSLLWYVMNKEEYFLDVFLGKMLPYVSHKEIDFYFFLEPHCIKQSENDYLIPTNIIADWWRDKATPNVKEIYKAINIQLSKHSNNNMNDAAIYKNREVILGAIDKARYQVETAGLNTIGTNITLTTIINQYIKMASGNSQHEISNIWPAPLARLYKRNKYKKIVEDELRYIAFKQFSKLNNKFDIGDYEEWLAVLANYMHQEPSEKKLRLLKVDKTGQSIDPKDLLHEVCTFVQSTYYMYIPLTAEEAMSYNDKFGGVVERPDVSTSEATWNMHYDSHLNHKKTHQVVNLDESVSGLLRILYEDRKNEMSPEAAKAIEAYLGISN